MIGIQINEIFYSIQGESTWAGLPCVFVRLRGCHLRCGYCDTAYAFTEGQPQTFDQIIEQVQVHPCDLVEITGGEPLLQPNVHALMTQLCDLGKTVLIETSGACDISLCDERVIRIMDMKTPSSGEVDRNHWENLNHLTKHDEVKFVLCDEADYLWAKDLVLQHDLISKVQAVLFSPAGPMPRTEELAGTTGLAIQSLAKWILADALPVRLQSQLHKQIWDPTTRGV